MQLQRILVKPINSIPSAAPHYQAYSDPVARSSKLPSPPSLLGVYTYFKFCKFPSQAYKFDAVISDWLPLLATLQ